MAGIVTIPASAAIASISHNFEQGADYYFFDNRKEEVPNLYKQLLAAATDHIQIWDPYYDENKDAELFEDVKANIMDIEILTTQEHHGCNSRTAQELADNILNAIPKENTPKCKVIVRSFANGAKNRANLPIPLWHDRYLIIDKTEVFLIGPSLTSQVETKRSFGFFRLNLTDDIKVVKKYFEEYRNELTSSQYPAIGRASR